MLDTLRRGSQTWVAKAMIGVLVLSFAVWGIADFVAGNYGGAVAHVGDTPVDQQSFYRNYQITTNAYARRFNRALTSQEATAIGLPAQVISSLVNEATFTEMARLGNLGASDEEVSRIIRTDPGFQSSPGNFNLSLFRMSIQQYGMSEKEYVDIRRRAALQNQITSGLFANLEPPKALLEAYEKIENEERSLKYISLNEQSVDPIKDPTDSELQTYFDANKQAYRAPEFRKIAMFSADSTTLIDPKDVSEDDVVKEYDRVKDTRFGTPERRRILQLALRSDEEIEKAKKAKDEGKDIIEIAGLFGKSEADIDLGSMVASDLIDENIRTAAFDLTPNKVSTIVEGRFNKVLLQVTQVIPQAVQPLSEVETILRNEVARANGRRAISTLYDDIEDARAEGSAFKDVAKRFELQLNILDAVDATGNDENGEPIASIQNKASLLTEIFESEEEDEADPVRVSENGYTWFNVEKVSAARDRTIDEVKERVAADWKAAELEKALDAKAKSLLDDINNGKSIDDVAAANGMTVTEAQKVKRLGSENVAPPIATLAFDGPVGFAGVATPKIAERAVIAVTDQIIPAYFDESQTAQQNSARLQQTLQGTMLEEFVNTLQDDYGVSTNQLAIGAIVNPQTTGYGGQRHGGM